MGRFIKTTTGLLIMANVAMFVLITAVGLAAGSLKAAAWFGVSASPWATPWTLLSYMFTDNLPINVLFNCLWLWLFSNMFLEVGNDRQLLAAYLIGGLAGALSFIAGSWLGIADGNLLGASAAILSIVSFAAVRVPYMRINLMFFGPVKFMWIGIIAALLSLTPLIAGHTGSGLAHLGGLIGGACYALALRFRRSRYTIVRPDKKKTLDELLDKVRRSGYGSLNASERRQLYEYSKNL